jgi:hypothetical protein
LHWSNMPLGILSHDRLIQMVFQIYDIPIRWEIYFPTRSHFLVLKKNFTWNYNISTFLRCMLHLWRKCTMKHFSSRYEGTIFYFDHYQNLENFFINMQIDIYLSFTSCQGNCTFCKKGQWIVHFSRAWSESLHGGYQFLDFTDEKAVWDWLDEVSPMWCEWVEKINISGNDPIAWNQLKIFMMQLQEKFSHARYTLKVSNTIPISDVSILPYFHAFEMSLYAHTPSLHNAIVGNKSAWTIFHNNVELINKEHLWEKIFFHTIPLRENLYTLPGLINYFLQDLRTKNPIKIVYPYFFPRSTMNASLLSRKEILQSILTHIPHSLLKEHCKLQNFPKSWNYSHFFLSVQQ